MAFAHLPLPKIRNQSKIVTKTETSLTRPEIVKGKNHVSNIYGFYMNQIHH
jgi:predicted RNA-binding protein